MAWEGPPHQSSPLPPQGSGRYSIYIANYAYGNVGPDALIEMDPEASDPSRGILALRDVAAEAGVSKYTGMQRDMGALGWAPGPYKIKTSLIHQRSQEEENFIPRGHLKGQLDAWRVLAWESWQGRWAEGLAGKRGASTPPHIILPCNLSSVSCSDPSDGFCRRKLTNHKD